MDPGGTTGYAEFLDGKPVTMGELDKKELPTWLWTKCEDLELKTVIIENYRVRPTGMSKGHANTWSECWEAQVIGMCKMLCLIYSKECVIQDPSIKPVGYGYAGLKYVAGKKGTHMLDAVAHGSYWWTNNYLQRRGGVA